MAKKPSYPPTRNGKNNFTYLLVIALLLTAFYYIFNTPDDTEKPAEKIPLSEVVRLYNKEKLEKIEVEGNVLVVTLTDGSKATSYKSSSDKLEEMGFYSKPDITKVEIVNTEGMAFWREILSSIIPFVLVIAFLFFMMRQMTKSSSSAFMFGKSKAKMYLKNKKRTTFEDVAGLPESKEDLVEIVDFLKSPKKYTSIGAKIPRGVLLIGAPGTGKTLLARAVAGEAEVPFFSISGSEFVEMFVGVGASRVRDLFQKAKRNAPCIIFIDEIDAVGRQRGGPGFGGGHDEREQTLNQILTEMDGFDNETNVIVIAATNRPDVLDTALLRPGRFDRRVVIDMPNMEARQKILEVHARNKKLSKQIDMTRISRQTPGFSGADLENVMNEAAIIAAKHGKKEILQKDIEQAIEKIMMGPERKSRVLSEEERKITAYHEIGHALVAYLSPHCDPVHKISIISRGMSLGSTWFLPEEDKHLYSESKFFDEICSLLGGRVAEKIIFGEVTTGASNDLARATKMARKMVTLYGMNKNIGPVVYEEDTPQFIPYGLQHGSYSEDMAAKIDKEINDIINNALKKTEDIIRKNKKKLIEIAKELLKKEVLNDKQFAKFFKGKKVAKK